MGGPHSHGRFTGAPGEVADVVAGLLSLLPRYQVLSLLVVAENAPEIPGHCAQYEFLGAWMRSVSPTPTQSTCMLQ